MWSKLTQWKWSGFGSIVLSIDAWQIRCGSMNSMLKTNRFPSFSSFSRLFDLLFSEFIRQFSFFFFNLSFICLSHQNTIIVPYINFFSLLSKQWTEFNFQLFSFFPALILPNQSLLFNQGDDNGSSVSSASNQRWLSNKDGKAPNESESAQNIVDGWEFFDEILTVL